MKKHLLFVGPLIFILLGVTAAALATPGDDVSGTFDYIPEIISERSAGGNTFLIGSEDEIWTGDPGFVGTGDANWRVKENKSGDAWVWLRSNFQGTVFDEYDGELVIQLVGKFPADGEGWTGTWVIISGTGKLAEAHGQGTWSGPGFDDNPETTDIFYEGKVHIEPN